MLRLIVAPIILILMSKGAFPQETDSELLKNLFSRNPDTLFQKVISNPGEYRLQVIYTQIDRDAENKPLFTNHFYKVDSRQYFNPASVVKMPLAFLALEKIGQLREKGIDRNTTLQFLQSEPWQTAMLTDPTASDRRVTIGHLIKRALLISENDPYNRLYQFLGQGPVNASLQEKGYQNSVITRQFLGLTPDQNRFTNEVIFLDAEGKEIYRQVPAMNTYPFNFKRKILVGNAHIDKDGKRVDQPFDFTMHNNISLQDLQRMLQAVIFPESVKAAERFNITGDDRNFLLRYLSQYPSETPDPKYDIAQYFDSYVKFFFRGSNRSMPEGVRVFNKVGWSYGFMTDVSYVADFSNGVEFMLAATLYVNSDGVINDDKYEYEQIGYPFLYQLGQTIYKAELARKRKFVPELSAFRLSYEKRDPADSTRSLKNLDN